MFLYALKIFSGKYISQAEIHIIQEMSQKLMMEEQRRLIHFKY